MSEQESIFTRRKFLQVSLGCLASTSLVSARPYYSRPYNKPELPQTADGFPITRTLGRTGIVLPIINAGGGSANDPRLVQACFETGLRLFDTDARYMNGQHEKLLGRVFDRMKVRDRVIIMTKVHTPEQRAGLSPGESKQLLYKTFEGCLRRLKTDYVDILLVHDVSDSKTIKDPAIIEAMTKIKAAGRAKFIGIATHSGMASCIKAAQEAGVYDVILTSINFTMADDSLLLDAIKNASEKGIGIIAMKTQAGGYRFPDQDSVHAYGEDVINSAALKWVCNNKYIATSIPGISNYEHLKIDYAIALNPTYTDEERAFLSDNDIRLSFDFCRQCRSCVAGCPNKTDIPSLMRAYMYARQYLNFELANQTLGLISSDKGLAACSSCRVCQAKCAHSINIQNKIDELKRIYS